MTSTSMSDFSATLPSQQDSMTSVFTTPPLTLSQAHVLNICFTAGYVLPLYFTKYTRLSFSTYQEARPSPERSRNDPAVIKARLLSVTLSTILSCYAIHHIINLEETEEPFFTRFHATALRLGLMLKVEDALAYLVTPALFLGPLYARFIGHELPFMRNWSVRTHILNIFGTWQGARNFIIGPVSEELVWRSCVIAGYHLAGASRAFLIFFTPVSFGSAHFHHAWETYNRLGRNRDAFRVAIISTLFQFTYTTLFGFHCAFLFLRSSSVFPPMVAHVFCNLMGVPQLSSEVRQYAHRAKQIKVMYVLGIFAYIYGMRNWTLAPGSFFWNAWTSRAW
ncbi:hypothetical protein OF83DRAFT_1105866 [Amylostereum chailletii]|nr:hypothetical protein OF83DRAFT_1105866 [Amylostereum chailletii]